jgi:uncharacterized glyoxalase superfamily protein PhnB
MSNHPTIWPTFLYEDAPAAITFLQQAFGFTATLVVTNPDDESVVEHAQLLGPEGGGIMLGTANRPGNPFSERAPGAASVYVVTERPDELFDRAVAAGAGVFAPLRDEDYGSRGFSVTDPEGNIWSFGTYTGEA